MSIRALLLALLAVSVAAKPLRPASNRCQGIPYNRYYRVDSLAALKGAIAVANPGDMVELMPGRYQIIDFPKPGDPGERPELPDEDSKRGASTGRRLTAKRGATTGRRLTATRSSQRFKGSIATSGIIMNKHGRPDALITICGSRDAILDGTQFPGVLNAYAMRIVSSSYIRISGFTLINARKGLDVQDTSHSQFMGIATLKTGQEGIRLRYDSQYNVIDGCSISQTGKEWPGWGEGIYVGTSKRNSVMQGLPRDLSHFNAIRRTTFGPGVSAENIDCKEFTRGGKIVSNVFNGADIRGVNGAMSWVSLKGGEWTAYNNTGTGLGVLGAGFRVLRQWDGEGSRNRLLQNKCFNLGAGSFCVYLSPDTGPNTVGCTNELMYDPGFRQTLKSYPQPCNCDTPCGGITARKGRGAEIDAAPSAYAVYELEHDDEMRPLDD